MSCMDSKEMEVFNSDLVEIMAKAVLAGKCFSKEELARRMFALKDMGITDPVEMERRVLADEFAARERTCA
jgi:hypothetical protein